MDAIERAARFYDCNKARAVVSACDDVPHLVAAVARSSSDDFRGRAYGTGRPRVDRNCDSNRQ
ncbi:DUF7692 domain-containing protein [Natronorubrum halophilum]